MRLSLNLQNIKTVITKSLALPENLNEISKIYHSKIVLDNRTKSTKFSFKKISDTVFQKKSKLVVFHLERPYNQLITKYFIDVTH